ncbi:MAG: CDP-alcohol phosphatidyltransferase family protein [bacterium]|nr:CDP-alcohol phosphatidyltransferase family protein [bacterium]
MHKLALPKFPLKYLVPSAFTLAALIAAFLSIISSFKPLGFGNSDNLIMAAQLIMLAMILDGIDGIVARALHATTSFGAELDTFVDFLGFAVAPAALLLAINGRVGSGPIANYLLPCLIVTLGATRLARFRVNDTLRGQDGYTGLPITVNAAWIALVIFISRVYLPTSQGYTYEKFTPVFYLIIAGLITLQVSNVHYPKPVKNVFMFLPWTVIVAFLWLLRPQLAAIMAFGMVLLGVGFVIWPLYALSNGRKPFPFKHRKYKFLRKNRHN